MAEIYVDTAIHRWRGRMWCHVFSADIEALHVFAEAIGLKRSWFQEPPRASWPHYDTTAERRAIAIATGALPTDRYKLLEIAWTLQGRMTCERLVSLERLRQRSALQILEPPKRA